MTQIQNSKNNDSKFWKFDHLRLGFVSDFDIRILSNTKPVWFWLGQRRGEGNESEELYDL